MDGERGVPHRRDAGLAIGLARFDDEQLVDRLARDGALGIVGRQRRARRTSSPNWPWPGKSRPARPRRSAARSRRRPPCRSRACALRAERPARRVAAPCRARGRPRTTAGSDAAPWRCAWSLPAASTNSSSIVHAALVARARLERLQHQQRHQHGAAPIGNLRQVEEEPVRQQHDLDRHQRERCATARCRRAPAAMRVKTLTWRRAAARAGSPRAPCACARRAGSSPIILSAK